MSKQRLLMGNEAIALGAIHAGVHLVSGYPGTPSTEVLETVAKENDGSIYVEWSVNEKCALEVAAGASYAGARTLVTMKQVGLNVASDPLMSLAYVGVKGGMVVLVADDPGPISSQTEQDTRTFAAYSKLPIFDPCSPEECYLMIADAFALSEELHTPVLFRPVTRVSHGCSSVIMVEPQTKKKPEGFHKDSLRWVIFPRLSYQNHIAVEKRNLELKERLSSYHFNKIEQLSASPAKHRIGVATGGVSYAYTKEALLLVNQTCSVSAGSLKSLLKIATPHPFPDNLALEFLREVDEVIVFEELDPVIEQNLISLCGSHHLSTIIRGKYTGDTPVAGELTANIVTDCLTKLTVHEIENTCQPAAKDNSSDYPCVPALPVRPPVLCAGCPHRASFYAVKQAMKHQKAVFSGDIGCYTLGNAKPLDMVDTCLCMGADVTIAQGLHRIEPDAVNFSFIGDSTFFASGITGVVNAVYNETDIILIVLDNSTTAMTGHQPHPGTGKTMMGTISEKISIESILHAVGVKEVITCNPFDLSASVAAVQSVAANMKTGKGVRAIIFKAPCIAVSKAEALYEINPNHCIKCKKCITDLGCPALFISEGSIRIEPSLCYGCALCAQICPIQAIERRDTSHE